MNGNHKYVKHVDMKKTRLQIAYKLMCLAKTSVIKGNLFSPRVNTARTIVDFSPVRKNVYLKIAIMVFNLWQTSTAFLLTIVSEITSTQRSIDAYIKSNDWCSICMLKRFKLIKHCISYCHVIIEIRRPEGSNDQISLISGHTDHLFYEPYCTCSGWIHVMYTYFPNLLHWHWYNRLTASLKKI